MKVRFTSQVQLHQIFGKIAQQWSDNIHSKTLSRYCFRHGISHLLHSQNSLEAEQLFTNFAYNMARLKSNHQSAARAMAQDAIGILGSNQLSNVERVQIWNDFFQSKSHILSRGTGFWRADKILLQLAIEHAADSPISIAAELWREGG